MQSISNNTEISSSKNDKVGPKIPDETEMIAAGITDSKAQNQVIAQVMAEKAKVASEIKSKLINAIMSARKKA